jgi:C4-dicarboxylate-specific signal transduction histidine kinase
MDDKSVLSRIHGLVDEERELRQQLSRGAISSEEEHARLRELEEALDQCWDLLRRRRAARDAGHDPDAEQAHSVGEVEGYLQ